MASHPEFDGTTSAYDVTSAFASSVKDKVILITGVNDSGIGGSTTKALASQSPKLLILVGRSASKVGIVVSAIKNPYPDVEARVVECELSSQASVRKAAAEINAFSENIDIVINNAGIMALPEKQLSADGIELQFATNHVGHFLLTNLILHRVIAASKNTPASTGRIINVSSYGHNFSPLRFSDLQFEKVTSQLPESEKPNTEILKAFGMADDSDFAYHSVVSYGNSKTANILFSIALNKRLAPYGIRAFALHPGSIDTELSRHVEVGVLEEARKRFAAVVRKTLDQGASTQLVAALDPNLKAEGVDIYLDDCQVKEAAPWGRDEAAAEKLWAVGEELVKEKFSVA